MKPISARRYQVVVAAISTVFATYITCGAQVTGVSGPVLGYVFDNNSGQIRPLRGIPGSATVGPPVELAFTMSQVLMLDARHGIASGTERDLFMLDLGANPISSTPLPDVPANPSKAIASNQGTAAAFYYDDSRQVAIVTGLPGTPQVSRPAGLSQLPGSLTQMAISNDGNLLVYSVRNFEGEMVYRWSSSSEFPRSLARAAGVGAIAITRNKTAIVADKDANEVAAYWDAEGAAVPQFLADARDGVSTPVGVAVSSGNQIYVVNAGSSAVLAFSADGRIFNSQQCSCRPSGATLLRDSLFRLTDKMDRPLFLLDTTSSEQGIVFVPPPRD